MEPTVTKSKSIPEERMEYPFSKMEVGEEFTVSIKYHGSVRSVASTMGKKLNRKFVCRAKKDTVIITRIR